MKNPMGKSRRTDDPYMIFKLGDWEWRVLKSYQRRDKEVENPQARWFLAVKSPCTFGDFELGDGYVRDIIGRANCTFMSPEAKEAGYERRQDGRMRWTGIAVMEAK